MALFTYQHYNYIVIFVQAVREYYLNKIEPTSVGRYLADISV